MFFQTKIDGAVRRAPANNRVPDRIVLGFFFFFWGTWSTARDGIRYSRVSYDSTADNNNTEIRKNYKYNSENTDDGLSGGRPFIFTRFVHSVSRIGFETESGKPFVCFYLFSHFLSDHRRRGEASRNSGKPISMYFIRRTGRGDFSNFTPAADKCPAFVASLGVCCKCLDRVATNSKTHQQHVL